MDPYNKKTARVKKLRLGYRIEYSEDGTREDRPVIAVSDGSSWALTFDGACRRARRGVSRRVGKDKRRNQVMASFSCEKQAGLWKWVN